MKDDDGNNITLYSGIYTLNIKPYLDYESPQILVTTNRFGYQKSFDGNMMRLIHKTSYTHLATIG